MAEPLTVYNTRKNTQHQHKIRKNDESACNARSKASLRVLSDFGSLTSMRPLPQFVNRKNKYRNVNNNGIRNVGGFNV